MGTKRPIDAIHPSRRDQVLPQSRKRQKPDNLGSKSFKKAHPVNALKSRVRDLTRLLAKDDKLPANIRIAKERELQSTQYELAQSQTAEQRSKMIAKYHQVRFFDRQKATKRLKQAQKRLAGLNQGDSSREEAESAVQEAETNVNYALYYPLDKPYSSLFPKHTDEDANGALTAKGDKQIRQLVEQCMKDGRLKDLREGRLTEGTSSKPPAKTKAVSREENKATEHDDDGDSSDGGFFE